MKKYADYYNVLGVRRKASCEEIKKAYVKRLFEIRPDLNSDVQARDKFERVKKAKNILLDPIAREKFDASYRTSKEIGFFFDCFDSLISEVDRQENLLLKIKLNRG